MVALPSLSRAERRRIVGAILRELRVGAALRQVDVAVRAGWPQSVVSKIEAGERTADAVEILVWCDAVGVQMVEFTTWLEGAIESHPAHHGMKPGGGWVRRCESCGRLDLSRRWPTDAAAEAEGVWGEQWRCSECEGGQFSLEELDAPGELSHDA